MEKNETQIEMENIVRKYVPGCIIIWSKQLTRTHGKAATGTKIIKFSLNLDWNKKEDNINTTYHEVAHILAFQRYGRRMGHKKEFREIFKELLVANNIKLPEEEWEYEYSSYRLKSSYPPRRR